MSPKELTEGWRLACRARAEADLKIELAQWDAPILSDDSCFDFRPREGFGIAIDLGTTTIVAQLLNLSTGHVLAVRTALNAQARHGADIMSRVEFATMNQGQSVLEKLIREQLGRLIQELLHDAREEHRVSAPSQDGTPLPSAICHPPFAEQRVSVHSPGGTRKGLPKELPLESIVLVGNTVMHHLFSGISVEPLSHFPFESESPGLKEFSAARLGWDLAGKPVVCFLPCLGGFVGSDILAGVLATRLQARESLALLIDLGTNGEIVLGNRQRLLCAGTAAGPAFEGARISMGMRAAAGAISEVSARAGQLHCSVLGNISPRGVCGSGLVDAAAASLDLGWILPSGRLAQGGSIQLAPSVSLNQGDIRELQLAKGAIAAGVRILLQQWPASSQEVAQVFLAGAFGNYINQANARRIGLLQFPPDKIASAGNTALLGAKLALFSRSDEDLSYPEILHRTKHVSLNEAPAFEEIYAEEMAFPAARD